MRTLSAWLSAIRRPPRDLPGTRAAAKSFASSSRKSFPGSMIRPGRGIGPEDLRAGVGRRLEALGRAHEDDLERASPDAVAEGGTGTRGPTYGRFLLREGAALPPGYVPAADQMNIEPEARHRACWYSRRTADIPSHFGLQTIEDGQPCTARIRCGSPSWVTGSMCETVQSVTFSRQKRRTAPVSGRPASECNCYH